MTDVFVHLPQLIWRTVVSTDFDIVFSVTDRSVDKKYHLLISKAMPFQKDDTKLFKFVLLWWKLHLYNENLSHSTPTIHASGARLKYHDTVSANTQQPSTSGLSVTQKNTFLNFTRRYVICI